VLGTRKAYQSTMRDDLVATIQQITGRIVHAFLSDNDTDPDIAVECLVLVPEDGAPRPRSPDRPQRSLRRLPTKRDALSRRPVWARRPRPRR
jgi:hypothetical protein